MTVEVEEIARRLTKAQRTAIFPGPGNPDYARAKSLSTMTVLNRIGLTICVPVYGGALLTPLGKAVRTYLKESHNDQ